MPGINRQGKIAQVFKIRERQISKLNRLLQKEGNITWSGIPPNSPNPGSSAGLPVFPPSQEEVHAGQVLNLRQVALTLG